MYTALSAWCILMIHPPIRLGVLGCAKIVQHALVTPLKRIDDITLHGIASRTRAHAEEYAKMFAIPLVYDDYQQLLDDPEIDCIYIALPNHLHTEWLLKAADAGKHVLVEKPLCISSREINQLTEACVEKRIHVLEGIMVQHHPLQSVIGEMVRKGHYGKLSALNSTLTFTPQYSLENNYRSDLNCGGGSFNDMAPYWLQAVQAACDVSDDTILYGTSSFTGSKGCDMTFYGKLEFANGFTSTVLTSFEQPYCASHIYVFENARVIVKDLFRANLGGFKIQLNIMHNNGNEETRFIKGDSHYENQLRFFSQVIRGERKAIPLEESFERVFLMEAMMKSAQNVLNLQES